MSQNRYRFGDESPPGCTAVVMLDESHCSVHTHADPGLMAFAVFTCGHADPHEVWSHIPRQLEIEEAAVRDVPRFASVATEVA